MAGYPSVADYAFRQTASSWLAAILLDVVDEQVKGALRLLLLPIRPELEGAASQAATLALSESHIAETDYAAFVQLELARWQNGAKPGTVFVAAVKAYLEAGEPEFGALLAKQYFVMHSKLSGFPQFNHYLAAALLSHARLIAALAIEDRLSSAQIAQLLSRRDPRLPSSWVAIEVIVRTVGSRPHLQMHEVKELFARDKGNEESSFGDASLLECIDLISSMATDLGLPVSFREALSVITTEPFAPHLKMLHFLCVIAEFYDHPLQFPYEFSPRGEVSNWLAEQYPASLGRTGNPFLNNAKSVDVLDRGWANSKKAAQSRQAHALVTIIESLSSLGFSARRELATWIRRLLIRIIRLSAKPRITLPPLGSAEIEKLLVAVSRGPTNTLGILEQRVVDALAFLSHPQPEWIGRGLGDSINATNISRRKCGDCDFQDLKGRRVAAYEPHAGRLTDVYVKAHKMTLARVLSARREEWIQTVGSSGKWSVTVLFVAHEIPTSEVLAEVKNDGVIAEIRAVTFEEFVEGTDVNASATRVAFDAYVRQPLLEERTPESIRRSIRALLS